MKKISMLLALFVTFFYQISYAGSSGGTLIPSYRVGRVTNTVDSRQWIILQLSNITDEEVDVEIWFYNNGATDNVMRNSSPTSINTSGGATNITTSTTAGDPSISFTLPAKKTEYMFLQHESSYEYGYGRIAWTSDESFLGYALIGSAKNFMSQQEDSRELGRGADLPLNGGLPF